MDFSMRINIKKVGERYIVTDDANIRILDTGLKGKDVWQHYFDVRHEQACEGKETHDELSNCIKPAVIKSLPTEDFFLKHKHKNKSLIHFEISENLVHKKLSKRELVYVLEILNNLGNVL